MSANKDARLRTHRGGYVMNTLRELIFEEDGAAAAEYALILAIVGSAIAVAAVLLGTNIGQAITDAAGCVAAPNAANC